MQRSQFHPTLLLSVFCLGLVGLISCGHSDKAANQRVILLGFDGMSPLLVDRYIAAGKLPNFEKLAKMGDYKQLQSSNPPQSPVAWSNFITGLNPGGHDIFDFIHRRPEGYIPYLSISRSDPPSRVIKLGKWNIPLKSGEIHNLRQGKAFWEYLSEQDIPVTVYRVPSNFPPSKAPGRFFSGMGTPDLRGTYGMYTFYSDQPVQGESEETTGGLIHIIKLENNAMSGEILGPVNTFVRLPAKAGENEETQPDATIPFSVQTDPSNLVAKIKMVDQEFILKQGEWSPWLRLEFRMLPLFAKVSGIVKFYLKEVSPHFKLYITPVNIDPCQPAMPISSPADYGCELVKKFGYFYTTGMPEDSKALDEGVLSNEEFLAMAKTIHQEQRQVYEYEFGRLDRGVLFAYFSSTDLVSHMFWRSQDPQHPAYNDPVAQLNRDAILSVYQEMDAVLGWTLPQLKPNDTVIVLSDHGFAPYYQSFHLNSWLLDNGYATAIPGKDREHAEFFEAIDWARTRAYGLGFNALYLNLAGREGNGIVNENEKARLLDEIVTKLQAVRDPANGAQPIPFVYKTSEVYHGPYGADAPDLIIGYNLGYRCSWESAIGKYPSGLFKPNTKLWSGDHCMAYELVPGIILSNRKISSAKPYLYDLAPSILDLFKIAKDPAMTGNNLFR